jgi:hypothetical protein
LLKDWQRDGLDNMNFVTKNSKKSDLSLRFLIEVFGELISKKYLKK